MYSIGGEAPCHSTWGSTTSSVTSTQSSQGLRGAHRQYGRSNINIAFIDHEIAGAARCQKQKPIFCSRIMTMMRHLKVCFICADLPKDAFRHYSSNWNIDDLLRISTADNWDFAICPERLWTFKSLYFKNGS